MQNLKFEYGKSYQIQSSPCLDLEGGTIHIIGLYRFQNLPSDFPKEFWLTDDPDCDLETVCDPWYEIEYLTEAEVSCLLIPEWALNQAFQQAKRDKEKWLNQRYMGFIG